PKYATLMIAFLGATAISSAIGDDWRASISSSTPLLPAFLIGAAIAYHFTSMRHHQALALSLVGLLVYVSMQVLSTVFDGLSEPRQSFEALSSPLLVVPNDSLILAVL